MAIASSNFVIFLLQDFILSQVYYYSKSSELLLFKFPLCFYYSHSRSSCFTVFVLSILFIKNSLIILSISAQHFYFQVLAGCLLSTFLSFFSMPLLTASWLPGSASTSPPSSSSYPSTRLNNQYIFSLLQSSYFILLSYFKTIYRLVCTFLACFFYRRQRCRNVRLYSPLANTNSSFMFYTVRIDYIAVIWREFFLGCYVSEIIIKFQEQGLQANLLANILQKWAFYAQIQRHKNQATLQVFIYFQSISFEIMLVSFICSPSTMPVIPDTFEFIAGRPGPLFDLVNTMTFILIPAILLLGYKLRSCLSFFILFFSLLLLTESQEICILLQFRVLERRVFRLFRLLLDCFYGLFNSGASCTTFDVLANGWMADEEMMAPPCTGPKFVGVGQRFGLHGQFPHSRHSKIHGLISDPFAQLLLCFLIQHKLLTPFILASLSKGIRFLFLIRIVIIGLLTLVSRLVISNLLASMPMRRSFTAGNKIEQVYLMLLGYCTQLIKIIIGLPVDSIHISIIVRITGKQYIHGILPKVRFTLMLPIPHIAHQLHGHDELEYSTMVGMDARLNPIDLEHVLYAIQHLCDDLADAVVHRLDQWLMGDCYWLPHLGWLHQSRLTNFWSCLGLVWGSVGDDRAAGVLSQWGCWCIGLLHAGLLSIYDCRYYYSEYIEANNLC